MTRKIIQAVIFTAIVVVSSSFTPIPSAKPVSSAKIEQKGIVVCLSVGPCSLCGAVFVNPRSTTVCATASCFGVGVGVCVTFATRINPITGKEEVDDSSISFSYSSPELKAAADEAALKADFIQQVNAQL